MLTDSDFLNYAMRHYDNPSCRTVNEFNNDLNRFKYLKKLFQRYTDKGEENFLLMLNHIMILFNVFEREACVRMLFFKVERCHWSLLKTFLVGLSFMPIMIPDLGVTDSDIPINDNVAKFMRGI
jgi:hypothetical protein